MDDLCTCATETETIATSETAASAVPPASHLPAGAAETFRYVLYFDLSQLQPDGRHRAFEAARRWVRQIMQPGDQVMIADYQSRVGLEELVPFTGNPAELQHGLDTIENNPASVDPFPGQFSARVKECPDCIRRCESDRKSGHPICFLKCPECCTPCWLNPRLEYAHGRRALEALREFLSGLGGIPGRKALIFFHENDILFPARFYPVDEFTVGDHTRLLEEIGAEATTSRVALYPVQTGKPHLFSELAGMAANLGSNLANYSGGHANRDPFDLLDVISTAGRGCSCTYRVAFRPPPMTRDKIYRARVEVHGKNLPYRYRVQYISASERLLRQARTALLMPGALTGLPLRASLVPVAATGDGWNLIVRVGVAIDSLNFMPVAETPIARLDVGARLAKDNSSKAWKMLTGASLRSRDSRPTGRLLLHEHRFENLPPGRYRLGAFVRQRDLDLWGGAGAVLELPEVRQAALAGPVMSLLGKTYFPSPLPLRSQDPSTGATGPVRSRVGPVPAACGGVPQGQVIQMTTLLCGAGSRLLVESMTRFVSRRGIPIAPLPGGRLEPAGDCARLTDRVETTALAPGEYAYHCRWQPPDRQQLLEEERSFRIIPPLSGVKDKGESHRAVAGGLPAANR